MTTESSVHPAKRTDVVATITMTTANGVVYNANILREDVTGTNGAYRAVRDEVTVALQIKWMLEAHRGGYFEEQYPVMSVEPVKVLGFVATDDDNEEGTS